MKKATNKNNASLLLTFLIFIFWGCNTYIKNSPASSQNLPAAATSQNLPAATIEFATSSNTDIDSIYWFERIHSFGDVPSGPPATTKFYFINKGNKPISISDVQAGCSCTATEFTKGLISPNDTGYVSAAYKTANTFGFFRKHVDVYFDHKEKKHHLILTGNVDPMRSK